MNCKYCGAPMEDGSTLCPQCGKDCAEEAAPLEETPSTPEAPPVPESTPVPETAPVPEASPVPETPTIPEAAPAEEPTEIKPGIHFTPGKAALAAAAVVVLIAVLVAVIVQGLGGISGSQAAEETTIPTEATATESVQATIPADGNPDDVTCLGSYTVSDEAALAAKDTVVATMEDAELTSGQLQVYYWLYVQQFYSNYYYYASYFGIDFTQPFDQQTCALTEQEMTWQQFFLSGALDAWQSYQALAIEFENADMTLEDDFQSELDNLEEDLETIALNQGFADVAELLEYNFGAGSDLADYAAYLETYYKGYSYFLTQYESMVPTDEEIEAYFTLYEEDYAANGITRDSKTVDVRHILILPEGATTDTIDTDTFSDEAWAAAQAQAEEILNLWLAGDATEDSFAELANEYSADPGSNTNGGLYEDVAEGDMVDEFDAWCFDESRQVGDVEIIKTDLGYHVMYYSGSESLWQSYAESDLLTEWADNMVAAAVEAHPAEITYSAIVLGYVDLLS